MSVSAESRLNANNLTGGMAPPNDGPFDPFALSNNASFGEQGNATKLHLSLSQMLESKPTFPVEEPENRSSVSESKKTIVSEKEEARSIFGKAFGDEDPTADANFEETEALATKSFGSGSFADDIDSSVDFTTTKSFAEEGDSSVEKSKRTERTAAESITESQDTTTFGFKGVEHDTPTTAASSKASFDPFQLENKPPVPQSNESFDPFGTASASAPPPKPEEPTTISSSQLSTEQADASLFESVSTSVGNTSTADRSLNGSKHRRGRSKSFSNHGKSMDPPAPTSSTANDGFVGHNSDDSLRASFRNAARQRSFRMGAQSSLHRSRSKSPSGRTGGRAIFRSSSSGSSSSGSAGSDNQKATNSDLFAMADEVMSNHNKQNSLLQPTEDEGINDGKDDGRNEEQSIEAMNEWHAHLARKQREESDSKNNETENVEQTPPSRMEQTPPSRGQQKVTRHRSSEEMRPTSKMRQQQGEGGAERSVSRHKSCEERSISSRRGRRDTSRQRPVARPESAPSRDSSVIRGGGSLRDGSYHEQEHKPNNQNKSAQPRPYQQRRDSLEYLPKGETEDEVEEDCRSADIEAMYEQHANRARKSRTKPPAEEGRTASRAKERDSSRPKSRTRDRPRSRSKDLPPEEPSSSRRANGSPRRSRRSTSNSDFGHDSVTRFKIVNQSDEGNMVIDNAKAQKIVADLLERKTKEKLAQMTGTSSKELATTPKNERRKLKKKISVGSAGGDTMKSPKPSVGKEDPVENESAKPIKNAFLKDFLKAIKSDETTAEANHLQIICPVINRRLQSKHGVSVTEEELMRMDLAIIARTTAQTNETNNVVEETSDKQFVEQIIRGLLEVNKSLQQKACKAPLRRSATRSNSDKSELSELSAAATEVASKTGDKGRSQQGQSTKKKRTKKKYSFGDSMSADADWGHSSDVFDARKSKNASRPKTESDLGLGRSCGDLGASQSDLLPTKQSSSFRGLPAEYRRGLRKQPSTPGRKGSASLPSEGSFRKERSSGSDAQAKEEIISPRTPDAGTREVLTSKSPSSQGSNAENRKGLGLRKQSTPLGKDSPGEGSSRKERSTGSYTQVKDAFLSPRTPTKTPVREDENEESGAELLQTKSPNSQSSSGENRKEFGLRKQRSMSARKGQSEGLLRKERLSGLDSQMKEGAETESSGCRSEMDIANRSELLTRKSSSDSQGSKARGEMGLQKQRSTSGRKVKKETSAPRAPSKTITTSNASPKVKPSSVRDRIAQFEK